MIVLFTSFSLMLALPSGAGVGAVVAPDDKTQAAEVGAIMQASVGKVRNGDHAAAASLMEKAQAIMAANPEKFERFPDVMGAADIARAHGDAVRAGKLGDPCPNYARARIFALRAQDMASNDGELERRDAAANLLTTVAQSLADAHCPAPPAVRPDPTFAGHYYLSGVMETGSELMLRDNGSFEWYISYGAVDQFARGKWGSDGAAVILTPTGPTKDTPLFTWREVEPWNEAAEDELQRRDYDEADDKVRDRCPFMSGAVAAAASPEPIIEGNRAPTTIEALRADAAIARQRALGARAQVELLDREELERPVSSAFGEPEDHMTATQAMVAWEIAKSDAIETARRADLPQPELTDPALPKACALAQRRTASMIPHAQWTGGVAVRVYDMASEQGAREVHATLRFADGQSRQIVTARRGLALLRGKLASPVVGVDLAAPYAPGRDQSFAVPATLSGIMHFTIDAQQLTAPPFDMLRLRIEGHALVPDAMGRGRYERQP